MGRGKNKPPLIVGQQIGRLTLVSRFKQYDPRALSNRWYWNCICSCPAKTQLAVQETRLNGGHTQSCGCLQEERSRDAVKKHGGWGTRLYYIWYAMKTRCYNIKAKSYIKYGAKGIIICPEWKDDFAAFQKWSLENGYTDELTIDRKDGTGNYEPSNCRWATYTEQNNNTNHNVLVSAFGETKTIAEWARDSRCVISYKILQWRVRNKLMDVELAMTTPVGEI